MSIQIRNSLQVCVLAILVTLQGHASAVESGVSTESRVSTVVATVYDHSILLDDLQREIALARMQSGSTNIEIQPRQILERLIERLLLARRAEITGVDKDPYVKLSIQAARDDVLARAYVDTQAATGFKPSNDQIRTYYKDHPALFADRHIYTVKELLIDLTPSQHDAIKQRIKDAPTIDNLIESLKSDHISFKMNVLVAPAEFVVREKLDAVAALKPGTSLLFVTPKGILLTYLESSLADPRDLPSAIPLIEQFLLNERQRSATKEEIETHKRLGNIKVFDERIPRLSSHKF